MPPYGRRLAELRCNGMAPAGWVNVTRVIKPRGAWSIALPYGEAPEQFDLTMLAGLALMVGLSSQHDDNDRVIACLEQARPAVGVVMLDGEFHRWIEGARDE